MELKLPPPLLFILSAVLLYFLPNPIEPTVLKWLALPIIFVGGILDFSSLWVFFQRKTTVNPLAPNKTTALATNGVYRFTRNPMYLSLALYLLAGTLWLGNPLGIMVIWCFVTLITRFQIIPEERILTEKFGQDYLAYQARVRRWL